MSEKQEMNGAQVLLKTLQDSGIELLSGYIGGAIMPTFDELKNFPKLRFITCRHEQGAGFMAQGYTRACGKLMPVLVTSGPGATNLVTPVADAMMDSVAMLAITGQVATTVVGTDAFQESDIVGLMYPITKYAKMPLKADTVALNVGKMVKIATGGRTGPVCLDIPKNVQIEKTKIVDIPADLDLPGVMEHQPVSPHSPEIKEALRLLSQAKRPVALVGHGVILSGAEREILDFLEKTEVPAALTLHGLSAVPTSHPLHLGMMGMHGEVEANRAIHDADLLIALGMRFDDRVTGKLDEYAKNAKVIHIEIDPSEINKNVRADVGIQGDLKDVLQVLVREFSQHADGIAAEKESWFEQIKANKALSREYYKHVFEHGYGKNDRLLMSRIIHELAEFTQGQDNIVTDVGQHQMQSAKFSRFERFNTWYTSGGLGTMGFGVPTSIGVKLARPDEEVWCVSGDGGFQMNVQELGTIMQEGLNINILLLNNGYLGMVKQWQDMFHAENFAEVELVNPNFEKLVEAYGVKYRRVDRVEEIRPALEWSKAEQQVTFVEFICDKQEIVYPMIPNGWKFSDMILNETHALEVLRKKSN
jgi:acetolactate synthase I/II/III large subunit